MLVRIIYRIYANSRHQFSELSVIASVAVPYGRASDTLS
ncbi:MAG: hypothetical protein QOH71_2862 [Blastocatellia bacterium]|jgi:hypothetical protein|nr:hypothetical protein [Blastocatellia bacterium]